ncbi:MAG: CPBP family intramembrane metalloprotease [Candidatus Zixiibacteriota bacterium]|nr:MAG: CPBP family intramembrane metalloprotease [candidate division Zixibacteria bacterium]
MNEKPQPQGFTVVQAVGIFALLLVAMLVVGGISSAVFGLHVALLSTEVVILLVPISFLSIGGYSFRRIVFYPKRLGLSFWILVVAASVFLFVVISDITGYVNQLVPRPRWQQEALLELLVAKTWPEYVFRVFAGALLVGFCEEFAFRGFLQRVFSERLGGIKGFSLAAFLFALMHLDPWNFVGVFLLGLFLGYLVYLTGNLWTAVFVHFLSNGIAFSVGFFSPDAGSDFDYTFPPYVTLLFTFLFIISLDLIRKACKGEERGTIRSG